jgi:hypothetical protein
MEERMLPEPGAQVHHRFEERHIHRPERRAHAPAYEAQRDAFHRLWRFHYRPASPNRNILPGIIPLMSLRRILSVLDETCSQPSCETASRLPHSMTANARPLHPLRPSPSIWPRASGLAERQHAGTFRLAPKIFNTITKSLCRWLNNGSANPCNPCALAPKMHSFDNGRFITDPEYEARKWYETKYFPISFVPGPRDTAALFCKLLGWAHVSKTGRCYSRRL